MTWNPETFKPEMFTLSDEEFREELAKARECAKTLMEDEREDITPHLIILAADENLEREMIVCSLMVPFNEADEKRRAMLMAGRKMYVDQKLPLAVFLISQAWMAVDLPPDVQPREAVNRKECVVIFGLTMRDKSAIICIPVERAADGKMRAAEEPTISEEGKAPILKSFFQGFFETPLQNIRRSGFQSSAAE